MNTEVQIAVMGVVGTLLGTVLGWILNNLSTKGKLKIYAISLSHEFLSLHASGYPSRAESLGEANVYSYEIELDIYNSSGEFKIMREIQVQFFNEKDVLLINTPKGENSKELALLNIHPKSANRIVLKNEIRTQKEIKAVSDSNMVYLIYKNEKNKKIRFLITKYNANECF